MRKISLNILNWIELLLPLHKRQVVRLAFLKGLIYPLHQQSTAYNAWRDEKIIAASITGQTVVLEWYLNYLFDTVLQRIYIEHGDPVTKPVALRAEGTSHLIMALRSEVGGSSETFRIRLDGGYTLPKSFRVHVPAGTDVNMLGKIVDTYRQHGNLFDIIIF